ncbi:MAG: autoinducer binding domain-containing protein, partial [Nitratireductor sp.]
MSIEDNLNAQNEEEIIAQIREAKTTLHAVKLLRHILEFKHASVYYLKQHTKPSLIPFIKTTYPKSWIVRYMFKQYGAKDPVLKHVARHVKP